MAYGTLTVGDLLANQATIAQIGEDRVWESIDSALRIHNGFVQEGLRDLVTPTTDQQKRFGGPDTMTMDDLDEMGSPDAQKVTAGTNVGFPLYLKGVAVQWTRTYFKNATGQEFAEQFVAAQDADVRKIFTDIKRAMYYPTNKTVVDKLVSNAISLSVKALTNADSTAVPLAPDGTSFNAATHTHYLYTASTALAAADVTALINTVAEHYNEGKVLVYINSAQETAMRALTGFTAVTPMQIVPALTSQYARVNDLDTSQFYNRQIGFFGNQAAEVWVKPWAVSGYVLAFMKGPRKPLAWRTRSGDSGGLELAAENETFPLRARQLVREYGISVWERTNGAVLYIDSGSAGAFVAPTIN
jgi:hypothetical protein